MHRARTKPFGYPGDYEVMNFVYDKPFEGATLFAKALSFAFLQTKAALAVKYRKDLMKRQLRAAIQARAGRKEPMRILSIAAGPAQELFELLSEVDDLPVNLEVVLFDQDRSALAHAYSRLRPVIASRWAGSVNVVFLNDSIKRLLRDATLFSGFAKFDYVYSVGLFDYLQPLTATRLARNLFGTAAPGGSVYIANMVDHAGRWFMEQHLEWTLLYRSREELRGIGQRAAPSARIRLLEEETGVNPFIEMVREG
jgi:extracellular factor (EF) 3-hydroxypalmitic acid methyl ester biosynthesis protein